nr:hypothetical protein [Tanacetum cinerariifolium]
GKTRHCVAVDKAGIMVSRSTVQLLDLPLGAGKGLFINMVSELRGLIPGSWLSSGVIKSGAYEMKKKTAAAAALRVKEEEKKPKKDVKHEAFEEES